MMYAMTEDTDFYERHVDVGVALAPAITFNHFNESIVRELAMQ